MTFKVKKEVKVAKSRWKMLDWATVIFAVCVMVIFICGSSFAKTAQEIYSQNKNTVIESGIYEEGGYVFSCGKVRIHKRTTSARNAALSKSRTKALTGFYRTIHLKIKWPENSNRKLHDQLFEQYIDLSGIKLEVSKAVEIDSGYLNDETCYKVLAVPRENIHYDSLTYSRIISTLNSAFENSDSRLKNSLYLEICPSNKIERVIPKLAAQLGTQYGANVRAVVNGKFFSQPPDFSVIDKIESIEDLLGLNYDQLFGFLNNCPYFPKICYLLGKKMFQQGKYRNANLFFLRGTVWKIDDEFNELCEKSATDRFPNFVLPETHKQILHLKDRVVESYQSFYLSLGPNSEAVINSFGTIPIKDLKSHSDEFDKGNKLFFSSPPDIDGALAHYLSEIEQNISADVCNMIGCCLRMKNQYYMAIPYLLQSTISNPKHRYAWVNLALTFNRIGMKKIAKEYARAAERTGDMDTWGEEKVNLLLNKKGK
ncbi:MAG: hypothetical protein H8D67_22815 [Deltaproteobacteria bacterium]|nr:hypothetical protein [Deltaproteobacteria bacterium]